MNYQAKKSDTLCAVRDCSIQFHIFLFFFYVQIADSFGGFDNMAAPQSMPQVETQVIPQISKAPKWLKRPCGATFSVS